MSTASEDDIEDFYGRLQDIIDTIPWGEHMDWEIEIRQANEWLNSLKQTNW